MTAVASQMTHVFLVERWCSRNEKSGIGGRWLPCVPIMPSQMSQMLHTTPSGRQSLRAELHGCRKPMMMRAFRKIPQRSATPETNITVCLFKSKANLTHNCDPFLGALGPSPSLLVHDKAHVPAHVSYQAVRTLCLGESACRSRSLACLMWLNVHARFAGRCLPREHSLLDEQRAASRAVPIGDDETVRNANRKDRLAVKALGRGPVAGATLRRVTVEERT